MSQRLLLPLLLVALVGGALYLALRGGREAEGGAKTAVPGGVPAAPEAKTPASYALPEAESGPVATDPARSELAAADEGTDAAPGTHAAADASAPLLHGRVVDEAGHPVADARVLVSDRGFGPLDLEEVPTRWFTRWDATTDADGRFTLRGPHPGTIRLAVRASGFAPLDKEDVGLADEAEVELAPLALARGVILSGRVVDADGHAVVGAKLLRGDDTSVFGMLSGRTPAAVTDVGGNFRVDQLACGPWKLAVEHPDYPSRVFTGIASEPGRETGGLEFQLERGSSIRGVVMGAPAGEALDVAVRPEGNDFASFGRTRMATVAADGTFEARGLSPGTSYVLRAREHVDRGSFPGSGSSRSEAVTADAGTTDVRLVYQPSAEVVLRAVDAKTGAPIEALTVEAGIRWPQPLTTPDGKRRTSFPGGLVQVEDLQVGSPDDRVQISLDAVGYQSWKNEDIVVASGQELDLGEIALEPVPVVRVHVRDAATHAPIEGALVRLSPRKESAGGPGKQMRVEFSIGNGDDDAALPRQGEERTARTDATGLAVLNSLAGRPATVSAEADGYARGEDDSLVLAEEEDTDVTLALEQGGAVAIRVVDPSGAPVEGARIEHRSPHEIEANTRVMRIGGGSQTVTNSEGEVTVDHLEPGRHAFRLAKKSGMAGGFVGGGGIVSFAGVSGGDEGWQEVTVQKGATADLVLVAPLTGSLAGRVTEAGVALAGATLSLREKSSGGPALHMPGMGGGPQVRTDGSGEYHLEDVEEGDYVLTITHPTRHMPYEAEVAVRGSDVTDFDVDLPVSVIEGRVLDASGKPVAGVEVSAARKPAEGAPQATAFRMVMVNSGGGDVVSVSDGTESGGTDRTDADGKYRLRGVQADVDLIVSAKGDGFQPASSDPVRVAPGDTRSDVDLTLAVGGTLHVTAFTADGSPAQLCLVRAQRQEGGQDVPGAPKMEVLQKESVDLTGLEPGSWRVHVGKLGSSDSKTSDGPDDKVVEVRAGETTDVRFDLP